jgi:EAL domain-containing protein (putative c-di-GMP-specific phosphodiesterase class I)
MASAGERDVTAEELLAEADAAMYAAKARGKNRYEIFEPSMRSASELRSRLRVELGGALDRGDFRMFFQPVVELPGERWHGVETLARWPHPQHGLLEPVDYAEIADAKGLIVDLDGWALMAACRAAACAPDLSIAVNVSGRSLRTPGFGDVVAAALTSADVPGSRLVIDVADLARDPERARPQIDALHDLGVAIALDSFTGDIPSLRLLRALGLKYLKLDPTVAADLVVGKAATTIAKALVDIAHELGIQTVARGVETARQRDVLSELGCDLAQGSLWAAPAPIEELTDAVNTGRQVAGRK